MSGFDFVAGVLIGMAVGLAGYAWISGPERRRLRRQRDTATARANLYGYLWNQAIMENASLLEHIGEERQAAAAESMYQTPEYYTAKAAREAERIDVEWFDLLNDDEDS